MMTSWKALEEMKVLTNFMSRPKVRIFKHRKIQSQVIHKIRYSESLLALEVYERSYIAFRTRESKCQDDYVEGIRRYESSH